MMDGTDQQYHIKLRAGESAPYVIVPGDPGRVPLIASFLDDVEEVAYNREYCTQRGTYKGIPISVTSTGIGGPSTAICVEELAKVGAQVLIRVGTSGGLQRHVNIGDLVVATGAIRDEGTTNQYIPPAFPAVPDFEVTRALKESAEDEGIPHHLGIVHCKDAFYGEEPGGLPTQRDWEAKWEAWHRAGTLCTEMEGSTLFVVSQIRGLRSGALLAVIGETRDGIVTIKHIGVESAIKVALEGIVKLEKRLKLI
jgi:uridine phosphorylase